MPKRESLFVQSASGQEAYRSSGACDRNGETVGLFFATSSPSSSTVSLFGFPSKQRERRPGDVESHVCPPAGSARQISRSFKNNRVFSCRATSAATSRARWWVVMSPSGSAQYSGRAAMMAKVASMAGASAEQGGAPVRLGSAESGIIPSLFSPRGGHTARFPPCASPPPRNRRRRGADARTARARCRDDTSRAPGAFPRASVRAAPAASASARVGGHPPIRRPRV